MIDSKPEYSSKTITLVSIIQDKGFLLLMAVALPVFQSETL